MSVSNNMSLSRSLKAVAHAVIATLPMRKSSLVKVTAEDVAMLAWDHSARVSRVRRMSEVALAHLGKGL